MCDKINTGEPQSISLGEALTQMRNENKTSETPTLEIPCERCGGDGQWGGARCSRCQGSGYEMTDLGKKVLDLLRHQFRPMLQDELNRALIRFY